MFFGFRSLEEFEKITIDEARLSMCVSVCMCVCLLPVASHISEASEAIAIKFTRRLPQLWECITFEWYYSWPRWCFLQLSHDLHLDMTFAVDWALKKTYLSISWSFQRLCYPFVRAGHICSCSLWWPWPWWKVTVGWRRKKLLLNYLNNQASN